MRSKVKSKKWVSICCLGLFEVDEVLSAVFSAACPTAHKLTFASPVGERSTGNYYRDLKPVPQLGTLVLLLFLFSSQQQFKWNLLFHFSEKPPPPGSFQSVTNNTLRVRIVAFLFWDPHPLLCF